MTAILRLEWAEGADTVEVNTENMHDETDCGDEDNLSPEDIDYLNSEF